jgi:glutamine---fructose-6-phosphate transaminase (isomerizing)
MCGIVGYIGSREAYPILIKGLERLEYRGYDSAGVAVATTAAGIQVRKQKGKVAGLATISPEPLSGTIGIGHTRWATHGPPEDWNAHPHLSADGTIAVVHNGIIENYGPLKAELQKEGHVFSSDTDTEVLAHLIGAIKEAERCDLETAVRKALSRVIGAYAIACIDARDTDTIVVARLGSPLAFGVGEKEFFIASDASPIVEYTQSIVYLDDGQVGVLSRNGDFTVSSIAGAVVTPTIEKVDMAPDILDKGGFDHYMQKEIFEQSRTLEDVLRGHITPDGVAHLRGFEELAASIPDLKRIILVACGTSYYSALVGEYVIESLAGVPVEVEYASEFRYRKPPVGPGDVVVALSQSGETADTLAALRYAKAEGAYTYGISNVVGSTIARETDSGSYLHVGPEIGVASTKAFTGQVAILILFAYCLLGRKKENDRIPETKRILEALRDLYRHISAVFEQEAAIRSIAATLQETEHMFYLGRDVLYPVALEGALKIKEIAYIDANGYAAGEMKHGPISLIQPGFPVVFVAATERLKEKLLSNMQEVKARGGRIIAIAFEDETMFDAVADDLLRIPRVDDLLAPLLSVLPLQLLAYHTAVLRGADVDKPRNLAKSVTVE